MTADLAELRRLAEQATPGPWTYYPPESPDGDMVSVYSSAPSNSFIAMTDASTHTIADYRYIAAANPAAVLELLDRLEAAEWELERWRSGQRQRVRR